MNQFEIYGYDNIVEILNKNSGIAEIAPLFLCNRELRAIWDKNKTRYTNDMLNHHRCLEPIRDALQASINVTFIRDGLPANFRSSEKIETKTVFRLKRQTLREIVCALWEEDDARKVNACLDERYLEISFRPTKHGFIVSNMPEPMKLWKSWSVTKEEPAGWPRNDMFETTGAGEEFFVGFEERLLCGSFQKYKERNGAVLLISFT